MSAAQYSVRPATPEDQAFLRDLFFAIRAPEFAQSGISGQQLSQILHQQYHAMRTHYDREFPTAEYFIYEVEKRPIGYHAVIEGESIHILDISIVEEFRNQGVGTEQMKKIMEQGREKSKDVTLTVEIHNPARRLYQRLGFEPYETRSIYQRMRWVATPESSKG